MVFSQPTFLFAFLPFVLAVHLVAPRWARNAFLPCSNPRARSSRLSKNESTAISS